MSEEKTYSKGNGATEVASMEAALDAQLDGVFEKVEASTELAGPPRFWDVIASGPYQVPSVRPSRLIEAGERAMIQVIVYLNPRVPSPYPGQNACDIITGFGGKIQLHFITSNMQTMQPEPQLTHSHCIQTKKGVCRYRYRWVFRPQNPACLYSMNICARICNCRDYYVPQYSGFARWIENVDFDWIRGAPRWQFDHPIRFMVSDPNAKCDCPPYAEGEAAS